MLVSAWGWPSIPPATGTRAEPRLSVLPVLVSAWDWPSIPSTTYTRAELPAIGLAGAGERLGLAFHLTNTRALIPCWNPMKSAFKRVINMFNTCKFLSLL